MARRGVNYWLIDIPTRRGVTVTSKTFLVFSSGWDGLLPLLLPLTSCRGDISALTMIISPNFRSAMPSLTKNVKPNHKAIRTKCLYYYYLIQSPNVNLSLRLFLTILVQINLNLQGCTIKAILVLTSIPYQIRKILKSNILKIIGIEILYPLYIFNPSYVLVDHLLTPNRSGPIFW
jgi:hypothetical protein